MGRFRVFMLIFCVIWSVSCGDDQRMHASNDVSGFGGYSCKLVWPDDVPQLSKNAATFKAANDESSRIRTIKAVNCDAAGIAKVKFSFYDENDEALIEDSWDCSDHSGTIEGIKVGENRKLICTAEDTKNRVVYRADISGITIEKDKITHHGEITLKPYTPPLMVPNLFTPADGTTANGPPIAFSWSPVDSASSYELTISSYSDFSSTIFNDAIAAESHLYTDSLAAGTYYWRVRALDENMDFSDWSGTWSFIIAQSDNDSETVPNAPANVHVSQGNGFLNLTWDSVAGADHYTIYWATTPDVSTAQYDGMMETVVTTSYLHSNLVNGTTYYYVVTAVNSQGEGSDSTVVSGTPTEAMIPILEEERTISQRGQAEYHEVSVSEGQDLFVKLSYDSMQNYYLYVKFGSPPQNQNDFDVSSTTGDDELAVIHGTRAGTYYIMVYAYSHSSNYSGSYSLTVSNILTPISMGTQSQSRLTNRGQKHYYQVACSLGQDLFVKLDYDAFQNYYLFVKHGTPPTRDDFDASSTTGDDELAVIQNTSAGIYYVMVYAYSHSANYSGDYGVLAMSSLDEISVNLPITSSFQNRGQKHFYQIETDAGLNLYINLEYDSYQNYYLYVSYGIPPTRNDYDFSSTNGDEELVTIQDTRSGIYYIMAYAYSHSSNYSGDYTITVRNGFN